MRRKLLLADDSPTIQRVIELTFASEDFDVVCVSNGQDAIDRLESDPPDVVLADVEMPERTGYEVSSFVKDSPTLSHIPVVLLTGAFEPIDEAKARAARCDGVLAKPFEPSAAVEQVRTLVANGGAASAAPVPASAAPAPAGEAPAEKAPGEKAPVEEKAPAEVSQTDAGQVPLVEPERNESVDDYLERLDAAFATLGAAGARSSDEPAAESDDQAVDIERVDIERVEVERLEIDRVPGEETTSGSEAQAAAPPPDLAIPVVPVGSIDPEPRADDGKGTDDAAAVPVTDFAEVPTAIDAEGAADLGGPPEPATDRPHAGTTAAPLADAFESLLAEEQGESGASADRADARGSEASTASSASTTPAVESAALTDEAVEHIASVVIERLGDRSSPPSPGAPAVTDELVDQVAARVAERMGDAMVRDVVADVVLNVADRLVREEIERIKAG